MLLSKFTLPKGAALALIRCSTNGSQLVTRGFCFYKPTLLLIKYMAFFFYGLGIITAHFPRSALSEQQGNSEWLLQLIMHNGSFSGQP